MIPLPIKRLSTGFVCAMVIHTAEAKTIHVADHGVIPGQDATLALTRLIHHIDGEKNITLVFPKGTYDFYPENASDQYRAVSNHDNSLKRIIFSLAGNQKLTIDGGGSDFIFHGRVSPFVLNRVDGATLKNFSIDWKRPFQSELKIVERNTDDRSFIVEIDPEKYPYVIKDDRLYFKHYNWEDPFGANIVFDPKTGAPIHDTRKYYIHPNSKIKATAAGKNRVKIESQISTPPPVGTYMIVYGVEPTSRLCPAIDVTHSKDVVIENVQIYAAGGMGIIAERTENIHLNNFNVTTRKGSGRLVSARADATHFIGCKGDILIENCLLEHMLDDSSNVHGAYVRVEKNLGNNQFLCAISHPQQWGLTFAEAGDKVAMLSRETILPFAKTTVKAVKKINEQRIIITLSSTPKNLPNVPMSLENLSWNANFTMRNNTIKENRARSVLITTKGKVLLENNYFSSHMKGILIEGDNHYWYESGAVQDVTIRNNVFNNIGYAGGSRGYALYASPMIRKGQRMGEGRYHRNIHFTGNTVKSFNGQFIFARSVDGLNITGNTFELSKDYPTIDTKPPAIDLHYCDNVTVDQNTINGFESTMNVRISSDTEHTHVSPGQGFVIGE